MTDVEERLQDDVERLKDHAADCDKRVSKLEDGAAVTTSEISSLRATRHEHGNWLNRHNLEISAIQLSMKETHERRLVIVEKDVEAVVKQVDELATDGKISSKRNEWLSAAVNFVTTIMGSCITAYIVVHAIK